MVNKTLVARMLQYINKHQCDFDPFLKPTSYSYNTRVHHTTRKSSFSFILAESPWEPCSEWSPQRKITFDFAVLMPHGGSISNSIDSNRERKRSFKPQGNRTHVNLIRALVSIRYFVPETWSMRTTHPQLNKEKAH